jgi:hypothetical protein
MKTSPKPATPPYTASAVAAPNPDIKPEVLPLVKVRCMQSRPIGPTGAAIEKPTINPRRRKLESKYSSLVTVVLISRSSYDWSRVSVQFKV